MTDYDKGRLDAANAIWESDIPKATCKSIRSEINAKERRESFWSKQIGKRVQCEGGGCAKVLSVRGGWANTSDGSQIPLSSITHIYEPIPVSDMPNFL